MSARQVVENAVQAGERLVRGSVGLLHSEAGKSVLKVAGKVALVWGVKTVAGLLAGPLGEKVAGTLTGLALGGARGWTSDDVA
jgi:hypothetical protein